GSELLEGAGLVAQAAGRAGGADADWLRGQADVLRPGPAAVRTQAALDPALATVMARHADRSLGITFEPALPVRSARDRARLGPGYDLSPRSTAAEPGRHGTFKDLEKRLPYIAAMGFDVLYLPPIHPVGKSFRKGPNNTLTAGPGDP